MIFLICIAAGAVIGTLIGYLSWRWDYYADWPNMIIGGLLGTGIGLLVGGFVGMAGANQTLKGNSWYVAEENELIALATNQEADGSAGFAFFVGYAQEGEKRVAYWTSKDEDGYITMESANATSIRLQEVEGTPKLVVENRVDSSGFWVPFDVWGVERETLQVPVGTTENAYEFKP